MELSLLDTFLKLGTALGLGLLVGLQRERSASKIAGIRTFPLVTMFGTLVGLLALRFGGWIFAASLIGVVAVIRFVNFESSKRDAGLTTEISMLLMFGIGAYLVTGHTAAAVVAAGTLVVLLHLKPEMHSFARRIEDKDFKAIVQFILITLVILPILPNQTYGPFQVLNPFKIWLMAVLIVGISLSGYVAYKFLGPQRGSIFGGILGGLVSSTAATVSYARRSRELPETAPTAALVIIIASATVYIRVLIVMAVTAPAAFPALAGPVAVMLALLTLIALGAWALHPSKSRPMPAQENPTELKSALFFIFLFAVVLLGTAAANQYLGSRGLYFMAVLSGLTDMDAITLSSLEILKSSQVPSAMIWRMIVAASLANLFFKGAIAGVLGSRKLFLRVAAMFSFAFAGGLAILFFWPL